MQMFVFLTWKEVFNDVTFDPMFFPSESGIMSESVDQSLEILNAKHFITTVVADYGYLYSITDSGRSRIMNKLDTLKVDLRDLSEKKSLWDKQSAEYLQRYIKENYPEYTGRKMNQNMLEKRVSNLGSTHHKQSKHTKPAAFQRTHSKPLSAARRKQEIAKRRIKSQLVIAGKMKKKQTGSKFTRSLWKRSAKKSKGKTSKYKGKITSTRRR